MSTGLIELVRTPDDTEGLYPDAWDRLLRQAREHGANREAVRTARVSSLDGPADLTAEQARDISDALGDATVQDAPPTFAHVGNCCRMAEGDGGALDSMPLSAWLVYLANGCRLRWMKAGQLAVLYSAYKTWCEALGERPMGSKTFSQALQEKGFQAGTSNGTVYHGVMLRATEDEAEPWNLGS